MFKVNNKNTTTKTPFSRVSFVDFEQVNVNWVHGLYVFKLFNKDTGTVCSVAFMFFIF